MPGLYIHIPYCVRKCRYCAFYSVATGGGQRAAADPGTDRFLDCLEVELRGLPAGFRPETVFLGGGTPTALPDAAFARLLETIARCVDLSGVTEYTCEANPGTVNRAKAGLLHPAGVNRISLGVQSFDPGTLRFLGRIHTGEEAVVACRLVRDAGIANLNIDLIFAVPGSPGERLRRDLEAAAALAPEHLSCYCLMFEPDTPLARMRDRGRVREVSDDEAAAQYARIREFCRDHGYRHYEISNFARPGRECRHNLLYWGAGEYLGCGPAAHSHWNGERFGNVADLDAYCRAIATGQSPCASRERLDPASRAREALVMGLRRVDGVRRQAFRTQTGHDYYALAGPEIARLVGIGMLIDHADTLRLSPAAYFVSDAVLAELV